MGLNVSKTILSLREQLKIEREKGRSIGFVPTMGALHGGHLSLIERSLDETSITVCSIFVNPTQFNDPKDLEHYPRTIEADLNLLSKAGCNYVFVPKPEEIYPKEEVIPDIDFGNLDKVMEGAYRQGHFKGVVIVVDKLFKIVDPHCAYFGEKDFQQLAIVRAMNHKLKHRIKIIGCITLRESDGLAMSSRNQLLNIQQRKAAPLIYEALQKSTIWINQLTIEEVKAKVVSMINSNPILKVQYFEIVDGDTLESLQSYKNNGQSVRGCIAVLTDGPRLIDNISY